MDASEALQYMADVLNDYEAQNHNLRAENARLREQVQAIRSEVLRDAADRAVVFGIDEGWICNSKDAARLRAFIHAGEES